MAVNAEFVSIGTSVHQGDTAAAPLFRANSSLIFGCTLLALIVGACVIGPLVDPGAVSQLGTPFQSPSLAHPFGTDDVGRDVFMRTLDGGRIDLSIAALGVAFSMCIGTLLGIAAGTSRLDALLMRLADAVVAFPFIVLVLMLVVIFSSKKIGPVPAGIPAIVIALVLTDWAWYARLARTQTVSLRSRDFVVAVNLLGFSRFRIATRHIVPSVLRINSAYAVGDLMLFMLSTAGLAFLGAGVEPPTPEWGAIMQEGQLYLQSAWWITIMPGLMLALTGVAVTVVADSLLVRAEGK